MGSLLGNHNLLQTNSTDKIKEKRVDLETVIT